MKIITFFSEKGGVGKTTISVLFASFLAYYKKETVAMIDFDFPSYQLHHIRLTDESNLRDPKNAALLREAALNTPYRMIPFNISGKVTQKNLEEAKAVISNLRDKKDGYVICDFPGSFRDGDILQTLAYDGLIDFITYIADSDRQSILSALNINSAIRRNVTKKGGQQCAVLWNRETQSERRAEKEGKRDWYETPSRAFRSVNIPVLSTRMRDINIARRDSDTFGFIRTTY